MQLILGSGSPRRRELLAQIGVVADAIRPPEIDETPVKGELPGPYCARMAREKAHAVPAEADDIVLAADTTVAIGRRILGKPADADQARAWLRRMSGRRHRVHTAVAVRRGARLRARSVVTVVKMKRLSERELAGYIALGDWRDKAGGYGIQGPAGALIPWIRGSFTAVVGLPLAETAGLLQAAGVPVWQGRP
jgi:septum formation protein